MLFLASDMLAKCAFFCTNASFYKNAGYYSCSNLWLAVTPVLPVTLLSIAALLNLNNWVFYFIKIGEMASHVDARAMRLGEYKRIKKWRRILNAWTVLAVLFIVGHSVSVVYVDWY